MRKLLSFSAGLVLMVLIALISIAGPATRTGLFVQALQATVNKERIQVTDDDLARFGEETMRYLRGEKPEWQPEIGVYIAPDFVGHMAQVRSWVAAIPWLLAAGVALVAACLFAGLRRRAFMAGMLSVLCAALALILWAVMDFHSFWMVLHRVLIPDGIFAASEPVMQLFPLSLFIWYVPYVLLVLAALLSAFFLIVYLHNKGKKS